MPFLGSRGKKITSDKGVGTPEFDSMGKLARWCKAIRKRSIGEGTTRKNHNRPRKERAEVNVKKLKAREKPFVKRKH